jgi:hypothetical protein
MTIPTTITLMEIGAWLQKQYLKLILMHKFLLLKMILTK